MIKIPFRRLKLLKLNHDVAVKKSFDAIQFLEIKVKPISPKAHYLIYPPWLTVQMSHIYNVTHQV